MIEKRKSEDFIGCSRRTFLASGSLALTGAIAAGPLSANAATSNGLIRRVDHQVLWDNSDGQSDTWFHPRACVVPGNDGRPSALMTLQVISGSDYFGPVHYSTAPIDGRSWSTPELIPALGWDPVPDHEGLKAGVCDVVPQHHPATNTTLAMGHVVYYRGAKFSRADQLGRYPVYSVRDSGGNWSERRILDWDDPRGTTIYSNNCGQRINLPDGDILMSFTFGPKPIHRSVAGVRCRFDGERLVIREVGPAIEHKVKRGLLEPSVAQFEDRFLITMRAEDDRGYVSVSSDGLNWSAKKPWTWDDGSPLSMSSTQQHWLTHSDALFLVYTRKDESNTNVIRWRAPLFAAQIDPGSLTLIRETERVIHPLVGDGVNDPQKVPMMGNFHVTNATPDESWVTVGSWVPKQNAAGQVLLARIAWNKPNQLL